MKSIAIASILLIVAATTLFSDSFESGDFSNWTSSEVPWTVNGTTAHTGVKRATATGPGNGSIVKQQSTEDFENITLSYWYKINTALEASDHVFVEWSTDGSTWNQLADYTGPATSSFQFASWPLLVDDQPNFQFRFLASLSNSSDVFWLDDVELTGDPIATPTPTETPSPTPETTPTPTPEPTPEVTPTPTPEPTPTPTSEPTPEPTAHLNPDPILNGSNPANENALTHILRNITRWVAKHL